MPKRKATTDARDPNAVDKRPSRRQPSAADSAPSAEAHAPTPPLNSLLRPPAFQRQCVTETHSTVVMTKTGRVSHAKVKLGVTCIYPGCTFSGHTASFKHHAIVAHLEKDPKRYTREFRRQYERTRTDKTVPIEVPVVEKVFNELRMLRVDYDELKAAFESYLTCNCSCGPRKRLRKPHSGSKTAEISDSLDVVSDSNESEFEESLTDWFPSVGAVTGCQVHGQEEQSRTGRGASQSDRAQPEARRKLDGATGPTTSNSCYWSVALEWLKDWLYTE